MNVRLTGRAKLLRYLSSSLSIIAVSFMALTPQDIANAAGQTARNILAAAPGLAADAAALYVKEGTPPSIIPNVGVALARQACRRYADNPGGVPGSVAAGFERVCRPYLDDIGYGEGPALTKPFEGGQCDAVYSINYTLDSNNAGATTGWLQARGPIGGIRERPSGTGTFVVELFARGVNISGSPNCRAVANTGAGWYSLGGTGSTGGGGPSINSVVACGLDNCGNPTPVIVVPVPPPTPGPRTEPYNPSPDIDIDIDVEIGPQGDITFDIGVGPIVIDPFGGGDDGGGGPDQPGSGYPPGDVGSPSAPADTGEDGVAAGCAPPNSVLVGVKVNILEPLPDVSVYDPLVRRGVCYVYMGVPGNLALDPSGVALRDGQFCLAPVDYLTCWEVRANVGYQLRVTPYYRALEPEEV